LGNPVPSRASVQADSARDLLGHALVATSLAVSVTDCIRALRRAGFRPVGSAIAPAIFERGFRAVVVPDVPVLDSDALSAILRAAGLTEKAFTEVLRVHDRRSPSWSDL
jgi:hypothetical protein